MRELELLLPGATRPYAGAASFRTAAAPDGAPRVTRTRTSCCMFYTVRPEDTCASCPRTCGARSAAKVAPAAAA